jgi:rSAM/selenodomain-associated transferase 1
MIVRVDLLVLAKEPIPGRVKTRLTPPCSPTEAAALAEAALADTLSAAVESAADRVIVAIDGAPGPWCPPGVSVVTQGHGDLAQRLATAWRATHGPALQIGMDTPQLDARCLDRAMGRLEADGCDGVLGLAEDGGWWGLGLRRPHPWTFAGIATSRRDTGERQRSRLQALGLRVDLLPTHRDVDDWDGALTVAASAPDGSFGRAVRAVQHGWIR